MGSVVYPSKNGMESVVHGISCPTFIRLGPYSTFQYQDQDSYGGIRIRG